MFFIDGKLRGLEKFMQLPKYPTKRGGGKYRVHIITRKEIATV